MVLNGGRLLHRTVQQVDDVMLDVQEQMEVANEIGDALAQGLGTQVCRIGINAYALVVRVTNMMKMQQYDNDELLAELEELEQLELDEQLLGMEAVPATRLPDVPSTQRMCSAPVCSAS